MPRRSNEGSKKTLGMGLRGLSNLAHHCQHVSIFEFEDFK